MFRRSFQYKIIRSAASEKSRKNTLDGERVDFKKYLTTGVILRIAKLKRYFLRTINTNASVRIIIIVLCCRIYVIFYRRGKCAKD